MVNLKEAIKWILRTIVIGLAMCIVIIAYVLNLITTGLRQLLDWILGEQNYWDLGNEWFQVKADLEKWYRLWRYGREDA